MHKPDSPNPNPNPNPNSVTAPTLHPSAYGQVGTVSALYEYLDYLGISMERRQSIAAFFAQVRLS